MFVFSAITCLYDGSVMLHMKIMLLDKVCTLVMTSHIGHNGFLKRNSCNFVKGALQIQFKKTAHF